MRQSIQQSASCLLCGETSLNPLREYRGTITTGRALFDGMHLYRCANCDLTQVHPTPTPIDLMGYYASDYHADGKYGSAEVNLRLFPKDNLRLYKRGESIYELLSRYITKERLEILDIGAGFGHILHTLRTGYPDARLSAIETSHVCTKHLSSLGIEVFAEQAEVILPRLPRNFDVIILSHVLEHFLDPKAILVELKEHLSVDGLLYIEVPNCPIDHLLEQTTSVQFEPHITFFIPAVLHTLLIKIGYEVVFCDTAGSTLNSGVFRGGRLERLASRVLPSNIKTLLKGSYNRVKSRKQRKAFFEYGGDRTWIRTISRKGKVSLA